MSLDKESLLEELGKFLWYGLGFLIKLGNTFGPIGEDEGTD